MVAAPAHRGPRQVRQSAGLELAHVAEQRARGRHARRIVGTDAQSIERREVEPPGEIVARKHGIELPGAAPGKERCDPTRRQGRRVVVGHDDLGGVESRERLLQAVGRHRLEEKLARAEVHGGEPESAPLGPRHGGHPVVARSGYPPLRQQRAGRERLDDLASHQPLGQPGILHLLADGDAMSGRNEQAQVFGGGLDRNPRQRDTVAAGGESDVEDPCRERRVLVEHLVEIADAVKEDRLGVLRLHVPPVLEHRGSGGAGRLSAHGRGEDVRGDWRGIRWTI